MALQSFPSLRPKTDNYGAPPSSRHSLICLVRSGGPAQLLICLFGSLACGVHNIPFELWLPKAYPREAPLLFVTPSSGIALRPTGLVDSQGRVLLFFRPEAGLVEYLRAVMNNLAMDPPFYPGSGRPTPQYSIGTPVAPQHLSSQSPQAFSSAYFHHHQQQPQPQPQQPQHHQQSSTSTRPQSYGPSPQESVEQLRSRLTEKVQQRFQELQQQLVVESDQLLAENTRLNEGEDQLSAEMRRLEAEVERFQLTLDAILEQKRHYQSLLDQPAAEVDPEKVLEFDGPLANQIADLVIEDLSTQDLIYTLGRVFNEGKCPPSLTLPAYLKAVRETAHDQFMAKALLAKIRRKFPIITN